MMRTVASLLAISVLVAACVTQSSIRVGTTAVTISGKVLGSDGGPLSGTKVVLMKETALGRVINGIFFTATTLGLFCLTGQAPTLCREDSKTATTDRAGTYSFAVEGGETEAAFGAPGMMEVITGVGARPGEVTGALVVAEFNFQTVSLSLPDLRMWQPAFTPADKGGQRSQWDELPAPYGASPKYYLEFSDLHRNQWWLTGATSSGSWVDQRVLEDLDGAVDVEAQAGGTARGTSVEFTYTSGAVAVHGVGPPPSRGALCAPIKTGAIGTWSSDCYLTNADLGQVPSGLTGDSGVIIDLGRSRAITLVVVRGCVGLCKVDVSSDLSSWSDVGSVANVYDSVAVSLNRSARYVRLTGSIGDLRQISVW